jgi:hypothetical protein
VRLDPTGLHPVHDLPWSRPRPGQLSGELRLASQQGIEVSIGLRNEDRSDRDAEQDQHHCEDDHHRVGDAQPERDSIQRAAGCPRWTLVLDHVVIPSR